jgi:hypothetical protein
MINKTLPLLWREFIIQGEEMKKVGTIFSLIGFILMISGLSCKKEPSENATLETAQSVESKIDTQKIEDLTDVQFKVLKTKTIGYMPLNRFYWVCLPEKVNRQKVKKLADSIIKEIIAEKPRTYHSFTVHFFWRDELGESGEESKSFACANFLPGGDWTKVGRVPIADYKDYKLTCTFLE